MEAEGLSWDGALERDMHMYVYVHVYRYRNSLIPAVRQREVVMFICRYTYICIFVCVGVCVCVSE